MKATFPPLPIAEEVFRTMVRMHEQRCTYEQIGVAVAMSAHDVEELRWKHLERWLKEREIIGKAVRSDFIMGVVAHLQLVLSVTENPKDLAVLTKAMEGILRHDPLARLRPQPTPTTPTREPKTEPEQAILEDEPEDDLEPTPIPTPEPNPDDLTAADVMLVARLAEQTSTHAEHLEAIRQIPTLYAKCVRYGLLPPLDPPAKPTPPQPPPRLSWRERFVIGLHWACYVVAGALGLLMAFDLARLRH